MTKAASTNRKSEVILLEYNKPGEAEKTRKSLYYYSVQHELLTILKSLIYKSIENNRPLGF